MAFWFSSVFPSESFDGESHKVVATPSQILSYSLVIVLPFTFVWSDPPVILLSKR